MNKIPNFDKIHTFPVKHIPFRLINYDLIIQIIQIISWILCQLTWLNHPNNKLDFMSILYQYKIGTYGLFIKQVQFDWYKRRKESLSNRKFLKFY